MTTAVTRLILKMIRNARLPKTGLCAAEIHRDLLQEGYTGASVDSVAAFCLQLEKQGFLKSALVDMGPYPSRRVFHVANQKVQS